MKGFSSVPAFLFHLSYTRIFWFLFLLFLFPDFSFSQANPVASFSASKTAGCNPLTVEFLNTSVNASSYLWDFGNGDSSTALNPLTLYQNAGSYSVRLIAFSSNGQSDTLLIQNMIEVAQRPVASFSVLDNHSCVNGDPVVFTNNSTFSNNFIWDFGDGVNSTLTNPSHVYSSPGIYSIALIAQNPSGCSDVKLMAQYVIVSAKPSADFTADTTRFCSLLHPFVFTPATGNAKNYNWNFHDGTTSTLQSPSHTYSSTGKYNVSLNLTDQNGCSNSLTKTNYIAVSEEITPVFSSSNTVGCTPLNVNFFSNFSSMYSIAWDFGDGSSSSAANPSHLYSDTGIYSVSLNVTDVNSCSFSYSSLNLVNTNDPLNAAFSESALGGCAPVTVDFTDHSSNATSWTWNFGDGTSSNFKNPSHQYQNPGLYSVSLVVHNQSGCESSVQKSGLIAVSGPVSGFSVSDSAGCMPLTVNFSNSSSGAVQYFWDFGDGTTSAIANPVHTYSSPGLYSVMLVTVNSGNCKDTLVKDSLINVIGPNYSFEEVDTINACNEIQVSFNGSSVGNHFWMWDFGDGTTSSQADPDHTFSDPGQYTVSLTTQTVNGCTITISNYNVVSVGNFSIDFSFSPGSCPGYSGSFSNSTPGAVSWYWNLGDGTFSNLQNPVHTYPGPGYFSVALTISTVSGCTYSVMKNNFIYFSPCPGDSASGGGGGTGGGSFPDGNGGNDSTGAGLQITGCSPFNVYFTNPFDSAISFVWHFGDGDSSLMENPSHLYNQGGLYSISLQATYADGTSDTLVRNSYIKVNKVVADFSVQQNNNCENSSVNLANSSQNASGYLWKFGDGDSSLAANPFHEYQDAGNYLIMLRSEDDFGCNNMAVKNIYAGVSVPVFNISENVCINDTVMFLSNMNFFFSYQWDFGDGGTSSAESPAHVFDSAGTFLVSLTVFDSSGCSFTHIFPGMIHVLNPVADFSIPVSTGCNTLMASFSNLSDDAESWTWDFGDGSVSSVKNPTHIYAGPGTYTVTLTAEKNGCSSQKIMPSAITVFESIADFSFTQNGLCLPVTSFFSDSSKDAVSWLWNFGDGKTDSVQNPVHVYDFIPTGNISLTITDVNGCSASFSKGNIVVFSPSAAASATEGCETLNVNFSDQSNGATSWEWNFGDGSVSSLQNPSHFYSDSGSYSVMLVVASQDGCIDTVVYPGLVKVYKVVADFSSPSLLSGCNPLLVNFIDNSLNATQWNWSFGDGSTSSQKNPWHIYTFPSMLNVTLIASNSFGCSDTIEKNNFVQVTGPVAYFSITDPEGCAPLQVQFSDSSFNNAAELTWYFGDGDTSHSASPFHVYDSAGTFSTSLLAEDSSGCSSYFTFPENVVVFPAPNPVISSFVSSGCQPLSVLFEGKLENTDSVYWDFGDGSSSHLPAQSHIYDSAGVYNASLIISNNFGCSDTFFYPPVTVFPVPVADFTAVNTKGCSPLPVVFLNNSSNCDSAVYHWDFGNGHSTSEANLTVLYENGGVYDVSLIVSNAHGCSDTLVKEEYIVVFDNLPPDVSDIILATVSSNTSISVQWNKSKAGDFEKYVLFRRDLQAIQYTQVAEIKDVNIQSYTDNGLNTLDHVYGYKLQSVDFCNNAKTLEEITEVRAMNVTARPDSSKIHVSWTPYTGCGIGQYEIQRAKQGQVNFEKIAVVDASVLFFEDTSWYCFSEYSYKIKAIDVCGNGLSSLSDTSVAKADENILANQSVQIVRSTVIDNSGVFTEWKAPEFAPEKVLGYKIYRSYGNTKFELIGVLPSGIQSFTDGNVDVSKQNYFYRVETVNVCNVKSLLSNTSSSILLEAEKEGLETKLKWTPYVNWENGVEQYIIERQDEFGNWQIIKIVDGNSTEWKDLLIKE